ncbi:CdiA C-terminal domain-containing protein [Lactococcus lactis]
MIKSGKIVVQPGRYPERHELETAELFVQQGIDVTFLPESRTIGAKSADIEMNGVVWEMKSPTGNGKNTIKRLFEKASKQSNNIIFDFRRCPIPRKNILSTVSVEWEKRRNIKRLIIILKQGERLDFSR